MSCSGERNERHFCLCVCECEEEGTVNLVNLVSDLPSGFCRWCAAVPDWQDH